LIKGQIKTDGPKGHSKKSSDPATATHCKSCRTATLLDDGFIRKKEAKLFDVEKEKSLWDYRLRPNSRELQEEITAPPRRH
jgi:hypothetical protein